VLDRPIRCQPFVAETVETFTSRRSCLSHLLAERFTVGGASEAGAWTDQKTGSAPLRSASEGLRSVKSRAFFLAMLPKLTRCDPDFA
jgi:hypothetical protein